MKSFLFVILSITLMNSCIENNPNRTKAVLELEGNWEFRKTGDNGWLPAEVPGTVHTDLLNNGLIEDPFYRLNELDLQWIDKSGWEYRCNFDADKDLTDHDNLDLVFEGLDTYAQVYLNDSLILEADNMFITWRIGCKDILRSGDNSLRVLLKSPTMEGLAKMKAYGLELPAGNDQSERGGMGEKRVSPFVRKAPYHFGWDWGPRLVTSGIWRPVRIEAWDNFRIGNVEFMLKSIDGGMASYTAVVNVVAAGRTKIPARIFVDGKKAAEEKIHLDAGENSAEIDFGIENAVLWWPNGSGEQKLYAVRVELGDESHPCDQTEKNIGVRHIRLVQDPDPDGSGRGFYFEVNSRPVFAKGANYIPNDIFLPRVSPEDYEFIIKSAADAHMNMLRVWGGGVYEDDLFYNLCDRYGILVWQDFMFACSMYPGNDEFLESVRMEAIDNVVRLRNHPCIALWCGNNEIEVAWAEWEENRGWGWKQMYDSLQHKKIWAAYDTLFHKILKDVVEDFSPGIPYWHSSPSAGFEKLASYETNSGDMHYWGVWHGLDPIGDFRKYRTRFMSEYGFQSFPEFNSVKRYTIPGDWNIESEVMASHQRSGIGNLRIRQYMEQDYNIPGDFERFLYTGQILQAEAIKTAIESHRSDMPYCMGSLYWQINDCWPVASWSGIDYYKRWKALHYFVREAYKPVIVLVNEDDGRLEGRIISDRSESLSGELRIRTVGFDGKEIGNETIPVEIAPNTSFSVWQKSLADVQKNADPGRTVLVADLYTAGSFTDRCLLYFVKPKAMKLDNPGLEIDISESPDTYGVSLTAKFLAKNIFLSVEGFEGQFSDNYFDLLPGEKVTVTIPKCLTLHEFKEKLKVLHL